MLDKLRGFVAILGLTDLEAGVAKLLGQDETDQRLIFNEQDAQGSYGAPPGAPLSLSLNPLIMQFVHGATLVLR